MVVPQEQEQLLVQTNIIIVRIMDLVHVVVVASVIDSSALDTQPKCFG